MGKQNYTGHIETNLSVSGVIVPPTEIEDHVANDPEVGEIVDGADNPALLVPEEEESSSKGKKDKKEKKEHTSHGNSKED